MWLLIVTLLLGIIGEIYCDENILLKVPVLASEHPNYGYLLNDGDLSSELFYFDSNMPKWVVFDLGDQYQLTKIVFQNGGYGGVKPFSVYIGNEFQPCQFMKQLKSYGACQLNVIQSDPTNTITCTASADTGRYLAIVKGDFKSLDFVESLNFFEISAYGLVKPGFEYPTKPVIESTDLVPITSKDFKISPSIMIDSGTVTIPLYSSQLIYLNSNCEPIIWDPSTNNVFAVVCQTQNGLGRMTVFGKEAYLSDALADETKKSFTSHILSWLSPKASSPNVVLTDNIASLSDLKDQVKPGDVIDFNPWNPYPDDVIDEMLNLCLSGTNSLSFDHTFWVSVEPDVMRIIMKVLRTFNMDYPTTIMNWDSPIDLTVTEDSYSDNLLDVSVILNRMTKNHDYFLARGTYVMQQLLTMSADIQANSDAGKSLVMIIKKYDSLISWICPCVAAPATDSEDQALLKIYSGLILSQSLANSNYKAPCIDVFPGDFETPPPTVTRTITIKSQTDSTSHPIGLYLAAGATLQYTIVSQSGSWKMSVGCQTDVLDSGRPQWYRYPYLYTNNVNLNRRGQIHSPFGGALWLVNTVAGDTIEITFKNVVATPFFNGRDNSAAESWNTQSKNPGLWAQISGETISFCEVSSNVVGLSGNYLRDLMHEIWDKMIKMDYAINSIDWTTQRPQFFVFDIMTSFGYGHSGYPISVYSDWSPAIFNKSVIHSGESWGVCHEVGHNLQDGRWTYSGLWEVTNNLLCLFNYDKLWKIVRYGADANNIRDSKDDIIDYLKNGAYFEEYKNNPWIGLAIYSQMVEHFGWGFFKNVFKYYTDNGLDPQDDNSKMLTWLIASSTVSGHNLIPLFMFWGIPILDGSEDAVGNLPCFLPDDFLIQFSPTRAKLILKQYPGCNRKSNYWLDYDPTLDMSGSVPNYITQS